MDESRPSISQYVVTGMQAPAVFTAFLVAATFLQGALLIATFFLEKRVSENNTELRLMQNAVQTQTAILVREGFIKPEDMTEGPTGPSARRTK